MVIMKQILTFLAMLSLTSPGHAQLPVEPAVDDAQLAAFRNLQILDQRLFGIGYRLAVANAPFCRTPTARAGFLLHDIDQYADQQSARAAFDIDHSIAFNAIAPNSPAERAGLRAGDDLLALNETQIAAIRLDDPASAKQQPGYRRIAAVNKLLAKNLQAGEISLTLADGEAQKIVAIVAEPGCASNFQIAVTDDRAASANGEMVTISSGLAEYFLDDDEFAAVVAHELAHNLLNHRDRLNAQKVNRGFFGQFGKSAGRIRDTEIEADRLSVWLMVNAGYDPQAAIRFWTRYGKEHGKGIFSASTHYRWKKRVKLFREELAKIAALDPVDGKYTPPLLARIN